MATDPPTSQPIIPEPTSAIPNHESIISLNLPISTKLTSTNYLTWKSQILPLLEGYNLARFLSESPPPLTILSSEGALSTNPNFLPWHRQDQLILGWLRSSLTELIQVQVVSCNTTASLWSTLLSTFSSSSRARLTDLRRKLQTISKGSASCAEYLHQIRALADELTFIGSPVSDDDLTLAVLNGLGPEFNSFVVAITTASRNDPIKFADLHGLLLGHEALLTAQNPTTALPSLSSPSAFFATPPSHGFDPRYIQPVKPNTQYQYSPKPNSYQANRPPFNPPPTGPKPNRYKDPKFTCQICAKKGHSAQICRWRYTPSNQSSSPSAPAAGHAQSPPSFQAYTAQTITPPPPPSNWVLDSGATHHVTSDLNNLSSFYNYSGMENLHIGNGTGLPIHHIGYPHQDSSSSNSK